MAIRSRLTALAPLPLALFAFTFFTGANEKACSKESIDQFNSPVEAVTTLVQRSDGKVDAELVLISIAVNPNAFVDSAKNARIRVPGGAEVPLAQSSPGHYTASSATSPALVYQPGGEYQFRFDLDDAAAAKQVAGGNFAAVMTAPAASTTASFTVSKPPMFAGDAATITWQPSSLNGLLTIKDASGNVVFSDFDFQKPQFDGSKWAELATGGTWNAGVDVFAKPGTYTVSLCTVAKVSGFDTNISAQLGALSGFLIGPCAADQTIVVAQ